MFAAKAGAKLVIGIDMSNILDQAEKIIKANGFEDSELSQVPHSLEVKYNDIKNRNNLDQGEA